MLTVGSLFTGIGGLDLGLERAGMRVIWQSEVDAYCCKVLAEHWPDTPNLGDIRDIDWGRVERPDVICGGYPCQPFSLAGRRQGTDDARHLWPWFADAIRTLRPRYAILENVYGHLSKGFGEVVAELSTIGYDAEWECIPAAAVGAPHLRDRLFAICTPSGDCVSDADGDGLRVEQVAELGGRATVVVGSDGSSRDVADADGERCEERRGSVAASPEVASAERGGEALADANCTPWSTTWPTSETLFRPETIERFRRRSSSDGHTWTVEPDVGRVAHGIPNRVDRLRALGNAVVPQVAQYIGELIVEHSSEVA